MWSKIKVLLSWTHSIFSFGRLDFITKTSPCNEHPLTGYFYIVKLEFTGVYIIFLFLHWNIDCGYLLEPPHWGGSNVYPRSMFWAKIWNISQFFIWKLGDNCIQICHLGRYIVGYTVGNFVLRRRYTSPNDKFEYGYPHSNVLFNMFTSKPGICFKNISYMSDVYPLRWPIISDVAHDVGFPTVYRGIYCRKFLTLSNQTSRYICKWIRINIFMAVRYRSILHGRVFVMSFGKIHPQ